MKCLGREEGTASFSFKVTFITYSLYIYIYIFSVLSKVNKVIVGGQPDKQLRPVHEMMRHHPHTLKQHIGAVLAEVAVPLPVAVVQVVGP